MGGYIQKLFGKRFSKCEKFIFLGFGFCAYCLIIIGIFGIWISVIFVLIRLLIDNNIENNVLSEINRSF